MIREPLDQKKDQLFYNKVQTNYWLDAYVCSCGSTKLVLSDEDHQPSYTCQNCGNRTFENANYFRKQTHDFLENFGIIEQNEEIDYLYFNKSEYDIDEFHPQIGFEYKIIEFEDRIISCYQTKLQIPKKINFTFDSVESSPVQLYALTFFKDGNLLENYSCFYNDKRFSGLKNRLNAYLRGKETVFGYFIPKRDNITLMSAQFFLSNTLLKEYNFYLWDDLKLLPKSISQIHEALLYVLQGRREKSIKKALFQNHQKQIDTYNHFKTVLINVVLVCIDDVNFIVELFNSNLYVENINITEEPFLKQFIFFLKKHYKQKQIVKFIKEIVNEQGYFLDTLREFIYLQDDLEQFFRKPKCTIILLHNELVRCSTQKDSLSQCSTKINYKYNQERAESSVLDYEVKLPYSGDDLYVWANELKNCLNGYLNPISKNRTTVYAFFKNNKISFAVEIIEKDIQQALGKYNQKLDEEQEKVLQIWYNMFFKDNDFTHNIMSPEK